MRILIILLSLFPTTVFGQNITCSEFNTHNFYKNFDEALFYDCVEFDEGSLIWKKDIEGSISLFKLLSSTSEKVNFTHLDYFFDRIDPNSWEDLLSITDNRGRNAMMISVEESLDWSLFARLISFGGEVDQIVQGSEESLVDFASKIDGNENFVALMVALGGGISDKNLSNNVSDMQAIINKEDWSKKINSLNYSAYKSPFFNCNGADLIEKIQKIYPGNIKYCFENSPNFKNYIDRDGNTLLHLVAQHGVNPRVIDAILNNYDEENIDKFISSTNSSGLTALHLAVEHSTEPSMVSRLIAWGSNPNVSSENWFSNPFKKSLKTLPIHLAAKRTDDYEGVMMLRLVAGGADVFAQDENGNTALHLLFKSDRIHAPFVGMVNSFQIEQSSFYQWKVPEIQNMSGATPLLYALAPNKHSTYNTIYEMLVYGAKPDTESDDGWTPLLMYASEGKDADIFELLISFSKNACDQTINNGDGEGSRIGSFINKNTLLKDSKTLAGKYTMAVFKEKCPN